MSTSILNVWVTKVGEPCAIHNDPSPDAPFAWVVAITHCDGTLLNWSEGRYRFQKDSPWVPISFHQVPGFGGPPVGPQGWWYDNVPTRNGHVEIEVPPGCYVLRGSAHFGISDGRLLGNWATDHAVVQACCGQEICTTLYPPSAGGCWIPFFEFVAPLLVQQKILTREHQHALDAVRAFLKETVPASHFERAELEILRSHFGQMGKDIPGAPRPEKRG